MTDPSEAWWLDHFEARLDAWIDLENPSEAVRVAVTLWIFTRIENPFDGARREGEQYWLAVIPGSGDGHGNAVVCVYWIEARARIVRCDNFATLALPI